MSVRRARVADGRAIAEVHVRSWQAAYHGLLPRAGEVAAIYLRPAAWGRGHGRALMAAALDTLGRAAYGQAALWVLDTNERARRFYEAGGWRPDGAARQDSSLAAGITLSEVRYRRGLPPRVGAGGTGG